ncbi:MULTISPECIES: efflux RND transporter periplasmic adaptor subunit [Paenibacillus]|uniref:efflux RND transporter periplasmic adaptor subunit n=1 Tax=Paenibacillus TaxID=44249 RepID=UPI0022B8A349|nr:biotin/lipoyl-binding protein [Paenibacillus caseinilyticus]MCZ8520334.1 biotin/lipoyl-binding protein [Paenibacillus caseinilyticus]
MGPNGEPEQRSRQRTIKTVFGMFMGLLGVLTLFGNTLQSLTLPKATTEKPAQGSLSHTLEGSGILKPIAEAQLTNPAGWKVKAVGVKEGDRVKKGQLLIAYDSSSAERELQDETAQGEKLKIDLQSMQDRFIGSAQEGDELKKRSASRDIEKSKIDLDIQNRKIKHLADRLSNQKELTAPFDGVVTKVNAVAGLASIVEPDIVIANESRGYRFEFVAGAPLLTALGIVPDDKIQVEVQTAEDRQTRILDGTIAEFADAAPRTDNAPGQAGDTAAVTAQKAVRVNVAGSGLKGGEQAHATIAKPSRLEGHLISNEAVHQDRDGVFIYKVEEHKGALGNVFIARKVRIPSAETNGKETVVPAESLYENERVILASSEPLQDGSRVRLQ